MRARSNSRKHSALRGHKEDLAKREQKGAFKQVVGATDTAEFLQELARKIKRLVANFIVREISDWLPPLCIGRLTLRSSKATSTLSRRSIAYSAPCNLYNLLSRSCDPSR
jgi:hypothetical protein